MNTTWKKFPVSMTELGIYLDWQKNPQGTAYNIPLLLRLPEGTDLVRLKDALGKVLRAHVNILSRFQREADGRIVRLLPENPEEFEIVIGQISGEPETDKLIRPFSDPGESLYRLFIIRGENKDYLFADFHHIIVDGMSVTVFLRELDRVYAGEQPAGESVSAADIAEMEREAHDTEAYAAAESWYNELISDSEIISAPIHDKEGGEQKNACFTVPVGVREEEVAAFVRHQGIRTSTFFTGVYGFLLSRFSGAGEALYASIYGGRTKEIAGNIGMFVKTFPVLERFDGKEIIAGHLQKLDEQIAKSREAGLFSYADACSRFHLTIPTIFAYQGELEPELDFLGGKVVPRIIQSDDPKEEVVAEVFRENS